MNSYSDNSFVRRSRPESRQNRPRRTVAYFVSPHGFGHAARAAAVMAAIAQRDPDVHFDIFSTVPVWFFEDSLGASFSMHAVETDVGFVQRSPFVQNSEATLHHLDRFLPFDHRRLDELVQRIDTQNCRLVISDISPLGIALGRHAGIPTVLIENFTWDWLYEGDTALAPKVKHHINYLRRTFQSADIHIQAEPVCVPHEKGIVVGPVSRQPRLEPAEVRRRLGIPSAKKMVLITTGGVPDRYDCKDILKGHDAVVFVIPGGAARVQTLENIILLPPHTEYFQPDLVAASDAVVGKVGYSTLAEVYATGVPFGYIVRPDFRESGILVAFIRQYMDGLAIDMDQFYRGSWLSVLPELLAMPRRKRWTANGARQIADILRRL